MKSAVLQFHSQRETVVSSSDLRHLLQNLKRVTPPRPLARDPVDLAPTLQFVRRIPTSRCTNLAQLNLKAAFLIAMEAFYEQQVVLSAVVFWKYHCTYLSGLLLINSKRKMTNIRKGKGNASFLSDACRSRWLARYRSNCLFLLNNEMHSVTCILRYKSTHRKVAQMGTLSTQISKAFLKESKASEKA